MGINMFLPEVNQQTLSVKQMCRSYIESMEIIKVSINNFVNEPELTGLAYNSAKQYFSTVYIPLAEGIILLSEEIIKAHERFPEKYTSEVDSNSLQSHLLEHQIQQLNQRIHTLQDVQSGYPIINVPLSGIITGLLFLRSKLNEKLQKLMAFHHTSTNIFSEVDHILLDVEAGLREVSSGRAWNAATGRFDTRQLNLGWSDRLTNGWNQREERLEREAYDYMNYLVGRLPNVTEEEATHLFDITSTTQHITVPDELYDFLESQVENFSENFKEELLSDSVSTILEASGEQTKNITRLIRYYSATWGPDVPNTFVMVSKDVADKTNQVIKGANIVSNIGRFGVPVIGGVVDFSVQIADGEDVQDALIKSTAHAGIGMAGAVIGATIGSALPIVGTVVGAIAGYLIGVVISAFAITAFDYVYDNRHEIYDKITDTVDSVGDTISEITDVVIDKTKEGIESVGNSISGFINGIGTVFG